MIFRCLLLLLQFIFIHAEELQLVGWTKEVLNDSKEQKRIRYTKEVSLDDQDFRLIITQVRNDDDWHWSQDISVRDSDGKWDRAAWNIALNDGKDIARWYTEGKFKNFYLVIGTAEKKGYYEAKPGQRYLEIITTHDTRFMFIDQGNGVYDLFLPPKTEAPKF